MKVKKGFADDAERQPEFRPEEFQEEELDGKAGLEQKDTQHDLEPNAVQAYRGNDSNMDMSAAQAEEPKFLRCITIARGACFGYVSLRTCLIAVALIDITLGAAALGIGIIAFTSHHLELALATYTTLNTVCLILALLSLYAIAKAKLTLLRAYYLWKCVETCALPLFEILVLALSSTA